MRVLHCTLSQIQTLGLLCSQICEYFISQKYRSGSQIFDELHSNFRALENCRSRNVRHILGFRISSEPSQLNILRNYQAQSNECNAFNTPGTVVHHRNTTQHSCAFRFTGRVCETMVKPNSAATWKFGKNFKLTINTESVACVWVNFSEISKVCALVSESCTRL